MLPFCLYRCGPIADIWLHRHLMLLDGITLIASSVSIADATMTAPLLFGSALKLQLSTWSLPPQCCASLSWAKPPIGGLCLLQLTPCDILGLLIVVALHVPSPWWWNTSMNLLQHGLASMLPWPHLDVAKPPQPPYNALPCQNAPPSWPQLVDRPELTVTASAHCPGLSSPPWPPHVILSLSLSPWPCLDCTTLLLAYLDPTT